MLYPFFVQAAQSPTRQRSFRRLVAAHLVVLAGAAWMLTRRPPGEGAAALGHVLLVAGIVEGAVLLGWRLTQLPKSQALEFLLVSPLRPGGVVLAEALVGLSFLGCVTLSGLPVLSLLVADGYLQPPDLAPLLLLPFVLGAVTGLGLTVWAYESRGLRRWGERFVLVMILLYLIVGVLAGENLKNWLEFLPAGGRRAFLASFYTFHTRNPFAVMRLWLDGDILAAWGPMEDLLLLGAVMAFLFLWRAARRLQGHFQDRHYSPAVLADGERRPEVGDRPLTWWAVKRVSEYSGRINLWLAGGFGLLYALYTAAGDYWPAWMGRRAFQLCDAAGGVPALATGLVLLAAVPAAFQYGLWDANAHDRCRRLELLLLTGLRPRDYWSAAAAAAWVRGRGYFAVALLLWASALVSGRLPWTQVLAAVCAGVLLWALYFALGFRAFARGARANGLGMLLTVGLPLSAFACHRLDWPVLAALLPPGAVHGAASAPASFVGLLGPVLAAVLALAVGRHALHRADAELRRWYDRHHGAQVMT